MKHAIRLLEIEVKKLNYILSGNYANSDSDYHRRCRAESKLQLKECIDELEILNGAIVKLGEYCPLKNGVCIKYSDEYCKICDFY